MSDIEILLRELSDKVDDLNNKVDRLMKEIKGPTVTVWGDDSTPLEFRKPQEIEAKDITPNPYEIKCDTRKENSNE